MTLVQPDRKSDIVALLEDLLVAAEAGRIESVCIFRKNSDKTYGVQASGIRSYLEYIGIIEVMKNANIDWSVE